MMLGKVAGWALIAVGVIIIGGAIISAIQFIGVATGGRHHIDFGPALVLATLGASIPVFVGVCLFFGGRAAVKRFSQTDSVN
jgi:predicted anti-sigma-YlaC factor YlaD